MWLSSVFLKQGYAKKCFKIKRGETGSDFGIDGVYLALALKTHNTEPISTFPSGKCRSVAYSRDRLMRLRLMRPTLYCVPHGYESFVPSLIGSQIMAFLLRRDSVGRRLDGNVFL